MTTITHIATGYIIAKGCEAFGLLPPGTPDITLWSVIMANGPDFDILKVKKLRDHRRGSPLHFPLVWAGAFLMAGAVARILGQPWMYAFLVIGALNVFIHFIMDSFGKSAGIQWLGPFSKREFSFSRLTPSCPYNPVKFALYVITQPMMFFELGVWIFAGVVYMHTVPRFAGQVQATAPAPLKARISDIIRFRKNPVFLKK